MSELWPAAAPLLNAVVQIRQSATHDDPAGLRQSLIDEIRQFEQRCKQAGLPFEMIIGARYCVCSALDEAAAQTPWGTRGVWSGNGMLVTFHNESWGGEKFFQLLSRISQSPQQHLWLLEVVHYCLLLGYEGRYRGSEQGRAQCDGIRKRLKKLIEETRAQRQTPQPPLVEVHPLVSTLARPMVPLWACAMLVALIGGLAGSNRRWEYRNQLFHWIGYGVLAGGLLIMSSLWGLNYYQNQHYLHQVEARVPAIREQSQQVIHQPADNIFDLLPFLNSLVKLPLSDRFSLDNPPLTMRVGLYRGTQVSDAAWALYQNALKSLLLPRVAQQITNILRNDPGDDNAYSRNALRAYQMLYQPRNYDGEFLRAWPLLALHSFPLSQWHPAQLTISGDWFQDLGATLLRAVQTPLNGAQLEQQIQALPPLLVPARQPSEIMEVIGYQDLPCTLSWREVAERFDPQQHMSYWWSNRSDGFAHATHKHSGNLTAQLFSLLFNPAAGAQPGRNGLYPPMFE